MNILSKKTNHGGLGHLSALDFRTLPAKKKWDELHAIAKAHALIDDIKRPRWAYSPHWPFPAASEIF